MNKKEMILALVEHYSNGNKAQFANLLGITPQGLSTWIKRESFDIELIFSKCEGVSANWLLTGKGDMLKRISENSFSLEEPVPDYKVTKEISSQQVTLTKLTAESQEGIPLIPFSAMAGVFTGEQTAMEYECERYVIPAFKGADFLIQIKGDSMQPTYYSGDLVACQRVPLNDLFFQWNKTYVLDTIQGPLIKRIMPGSDNNHVMIVSDNSSYPSFELSKDQFNGVALVRGLVRLE